MDNHIINILESRARYLLMALGLLLIALAQTFHCEILNVNVSELTAHIGALLLIIGLLHWLFDSAIRKHMQEEIFSSVTGSTRLHAAGLSNATANSKEVDYRDIINTANEVVIGEHYSTRLFDDYSSEFLARHKSGKSTTTLLVNPDSEAAEYILKYCSSRTVLSDPIYKIKTILFHKDLAGKERELVKILFHSRILRYTFVKGDNQIWVRMFTNSSGHSNVPAFCVRPGSPLYNFFNSDISRLISECTEA